MFAERTEFKTALHSSAFRTLFFCLFWISVQGSRRFPVRYHLIGSSKPIVVAPGDDVILPCRVLPRWDAKRKTVEWSKLDLKADASDGRRGVEYVFVYRFQRPDRDVMMASYIQRTSLSSDGLKRGDVSLRIRNVTLEDSGTFRCFVPNLRIDAEVRLDVDPNVTVTMPSETPMFNRTSGRTDRPRDRVNIVPIIVFCIIRFIIHKGRDAPESDPESAQPPCSKAEEELLQDQVENQPDNPDPPPK